MMDERWWYLSNKAKRKPIQRVKTGEGKKKQK